MREVVIVGIARTAFGSFQGVLSTESAPKLGACAIKGALKNAHVSPESVDEVIMGNVLAAGVGQGPARQAAIGAGIPKSAHALTINKLCGSGMKAVMLAVQAIQLGDSEVVVAGGMENMSMAPYLIPGARSGLRMGNQTIVDSMIEDGLWDPYHNKHMGHCAELCAREKTFTREAQDEYAIQSFKRAQEAQQAGKFKNEIVAYEMTNKKGEVTRIDSDEGPAKAVFDKIPKLKPVFDKDGSVTAANSSTINDGATALVLMSADMAKAKGLKPLAKVVSYATHSQDPQWFTTAPVEGIKKALSRAKWNVADVDLFEVNEAFAVVAMAARDGVGIPNDRLNVWGGAIALGHPIGASGARIVVTLLSAMQDKNVQRGLAGICIGGGEATAICLERFT